MDLAPVEKQSEWDCEKEKKKKGDRETTAGWTRKRMGYKSQRAQILPPSISALCECIEEFKYCAPIALKADREKRHENERNEIKERERIIKKKERRANEPQWRGLDYKIAAPEIRLKW